MSPFETRPLIMDLGVVRAGTTERRRFNITNLNPVVLNLTSPGGSGALPFASLTLLGISPLALAPQTLLDIGKHVEVRASVYWF